MYSPVPLAHVIDPNKPESKAPCVRMFVEIISHAVQSKATDVYIRRGTPLVFRSSGELQYGVDWNVGEKNVFPKQLFAELVTWLAKQKGGEEEPDPKVPAENDKASKVPLSFTKIFRLQQTQIRIQYSGFFQPAELLLRLQPITPWPLENYIGKFPHTKELLRKASGFVLVCGPIGSGKTSLMSSIVEYWASAASVDKKGSKHVVMMGDPIEYYLPPERYIVSNVQCALTESAARDGVPYISDIIPDVLRSDIDALSVGEIREPRILQECMKFSGAREPIIATFHAGSIAECIVRVLGMAEQTMSRETARLMLSACLEGVFYINIGYTDKGVAVPVVEFLPCEGQVRAAIAKGDPAALVKTIEEQLKQGQSKGAIYRRQAIEVARELGLNDAETNTLLGPMAT